MRFTFFYEKYVNFAMDLVDLLKLKGLTSNTNIQTNGTKLENT